MTTATLDHHDTALPLLLTFEQTADLTGFKVAHLRRLCRDSVLPSVRCGRLIRIPRAALEARLAELTNQPSSLSV